MFSWSLTHILYFPWFYVTNFAVSLPGLGPEDFRDPKSIRSLKQEIDRLYVMLLTPLPPAVPNLVTAIMTPQPVVPPSNESDTVNKDDDMWPCL